MGKNKVIESTDKDSCRVNIYVKNGRLRKAMKESDNQSEFFEIAGLYYLDSVEKGYVTADQLDIVNKNYLELKEQIDGIVSSLFGLEE